MKIGEGYRADVYQVFAFRWTLGFGIHLGHTEGKTLKVSSDNGNLTLAEFDGLVLSLPFCEIIYGTVYIPKDPVTFVPD